MWLCVMQNESEMENFRQRLDHRGRSERTVRRSEGRGEGDKNDERFRLFGYELLVIAYQKIVELCESWTWL